MRSVKLHQGQRDFWEKEHKTPYVFLAMDSEKPSSGIPLLYIWLKEKGLVKGLQGVEMGAGKGRNSMWLAKHGIEMAAFDFSEVAIGEAKKRAESEKVKNVNFFVHDAIKRWPCASNSFDLAIDCFASTDIDSFQGRLFAREEFKRVLRPKGYLFVYALSTDDEFHKEMALQFPTSEKNSFLHPAGQFNKVFAREELIEFYKDFTILEERRINKVANFFGKDYKCKHFWLILQNNT